MLVELPSMAHISLKPCNNIPAFVILTWHGFLLSALWQINDLLNKSDRTVLFVFFFNCYYLSLLFICLFVVFVCCCLIIYVFVCCCCFIIYLCDDDYEDEIDFGHWGVNQKRLTYLWTHEDRFTMMRFNMFNDTHVRRYISYISVLCIFIL